MEITIGDIIINMYKQAHFNGRFAYVFWGIFCVIYVYSSLYDKLNGLKKTNRKVSKKNFPYTLWVCGALSIIIHHLSIDYDFVWPFPKDASLWIAGGTIFMVSGLIIIAWARATLDGYWGPNIYKYDTQDSKLITIGIYKMMRHPVYVGQLLLTVGTVFLANNILIGFFPIATLIFNHIRAHREDKDLLQRFPDTFPEYRNTTSFYGIL